MSDLALANKYRPKKMSDLVGQDHIVKILSNAIMNNVLHHAYLFGGKFGCGKTSAARLLAACINDGDKPSLEPDISNPTIQAIFEGKSIDVKEIDAASNRGIEDIRALKENVAYAPIECRYKVVIIDECLSKLSRIDTEVGRIPIGVIVNNKLTPRVKSYNEQTGQIEWKKITGWFKNSGKEIFKVAFEGRGRVYASDGHLFSTPSGYLPLKELSVGDIVYRIGKPLSEIQKQVILGSLLGDMSIQRNSSKSQKWGKERKFSACRCRIKMIHGENQFEYIDFKKAILETVLPMNKRDFLHSGFAGCNPKPMRSYVSKTSSSLSSIFNITMDTQSSHPRKIINGRWLEYINTLGLAIWFCDDGSTNKKSTKNGISPTVSFHTQGYSKKENETIAQWFNKKGYEAKVISSGKRNLWQINLSVEGSLKLIRDISPYIPACMRYKIDGITGISEFDSSLFTSNEMEQRDEITEEVITSITSQGYNDVTYDLEIEDNHNYFCSDTLVHNCHRLTDAAAEAALKMLEEPPRNVIFILCTTDVHKLKETIYSRCQPLRFSKVPWNVIAQQLTKVSKLESFEIEENAVKLAARMSKGSMRNALQNLQMMATLAGGKAITKEIAEQALGSMDDGHFFNLVDAIVKPDAGEAMRVIDRLLSEGRDIGDVLEGLVGHLRVLLLARTCQTTSGLVYLSESEMKRFEIQKGTVHLQLIVRMIELVGDVHRSMNLNMSPQVALEMFVVKSIIEGAHLKKAS